MTDVLMQYGLFLAKVVTVVFALGVIIAMGAAASRRARHGEGVEVSHLNHKYEAMVEALEKSVLSKHELKQRSKSKKAKHKTEKKERKAEPNARKRTYVLNFHGDIKASAVASLREEVTAVLGIARPQDDVLVCLENTGGLVHDHGLAASQLRRVKAKEIPLTVAVDKVAASGGYLMACIADRIIAAPFAVIGSIGVVAQMPNFSRLLDKHGVDFEQITAGEFKRTLTIFGKNTDKERAKVKADLEDVHELFKEVIREHRPELDMERVSTGEHWFGTRALELGLVDELATSDDFLLNASHDADLYQVSYKAKKSLTDKVVSAMQLVADKLLLLWWQRSRESRVIS